MIIGGNYDNYIEGDIKNHNPACLVFLRLLIDTEFSLSDEEKNKIRKIVVPESTDIVIENKTVLSPIFNYFYSNIIGNNDIASKNKEITKRLTEFFEINTLNPDINIVDIFTKLCDNNLELNAKKYFYIFSILYVSSATIINLDTKLKDNELYVFADDDTFNLKNRVESYNPNNTANTDGYKNFVDMFQPIYELTNENPVGGFLNKYKTITHPKLNNSILSDVIQNFMLTNKITITLPAVVGGFSINLMSEKQKRTKKYHSAKNEKLTKNKTRKS
jgi:hypothetical protein